MNNALTTDDLTDLAAVIAGTTDSSGNRRNLRTSELDDRGARLFGFGLAVEVGGHLVATEAGHCELEARGL